MKHSKELEKFVKGAANHRRIDILKLVAVNPGITVEGISGRLDCNFQVIAVHARKLSQTGLLDKEYRGRAVGHTVSPYGRKFLTFLGTL